MAKNEVHALQASAPEERMRRFAAAGGELTVQVLAPDLVRVRFGPRSPHAERSSWAVVKADWPAAEVRWEEDAESYLLDTGVLHLRVDKGPLRLVFQDPDRQEFLILGNLSAGGEGVGGAGPAVGRAEGASVSGARAELALLPNDHFYGFGQKLGFLDKRGQSMAQWATDDPHHTPDKDTLYQAIPFYLGVNEGRAYGLFMDSPALTRFDMGRTDPSQGAISTEEDELDLYVFFGPDPKAVVSRYTELTGRMEMPPLWALGYQQSRYSYYPESEVREIAREFRQRGIPCDVIYLDIHYMDGYRVFTWDPERFPDPSGLLSDLAKDGFRVVPIIDPGVKAEPGYPVYDDGLARRVFIEESPGKPYIGAVWPGASAFPDFTRDETRRWWGDHHKPLTDAGVAGIWDDMNEPANFTTESEPRPLWKTIPLDLMQGEEEERRPHRLVHNLYGMSMSRATREGLQRLRPDERPFVLTRSGYAGIQRYAAVWMGDNHSWWEHLLQAMPTCLGMGLSGVPFVGTDAGGFGGDATPELLVRWTQMGTFTPFFRNHSAIDTRRQEPWAFGPETEAIVRDWIRLRYRFLPYIYTAFEEAHRTGLPIMRPLLLEYPTDPNTVNLSDQYLFGRDLLVAPVYQPGARQRLVYLPEGDWYDYWTGVRYDGRRHILAEAPLERMPLFVRGGAALPLGPVRQYVGEPVPPELTLEVFPGNGSCELYEDDGQSLGYSHGEYCRAPIAVQADAQSVTVTIGPAEGVYRAARERWLLRFRGSSLERPRRVTVDGQVAEWSRDADGAVVVSVPARESALSVRVER